MGINVYDVTGIGRYYKATYHQDQTLIPRTAALIQIQGNRTMLQVMEHY